LATWSTLFPDGNAPLVMNAGFGVFRDPLSNFSNFDTNGTSLAFGFGDYFGNFNNDEQFST
jgi:hypothetical protein